MYYTACLLLTIQWQLLCQAIVSLIYKWEGLLKIVWGGGGGLQPQQPPPPRSAPGSSTIDEIWQFSQFAFFGELALGGGGGGGEGGFPYSVYLV